MILAFALNITTVPFTAADLVLVMGGIGAMFFGAGKGIAFIIREFKRKGGDPAPTPPADDSDLMDMKTDLAVVKAQIGTNTDAISDTNANVVKVALATPTAAKTPPLTPPPAKP